MNARINKLLIIVCLLPSQLSIAAPLEVSFHWGPGAHYESCYEQVQQTISTLLGNEKFLEMKSHFPQVQSVGVYLYPLQEKSSYSGYYNSQMAPDTVVLDPSRDGTCQWTSSRQAMSFARDFVHEVHHLLLFKSGKVYSWEINEGLSILWESLVTETVKPIYRKRYHRNQQIQDYQIAFQAILDLYNQYPTRFFSCVYEQQTLLSLEELNRHLVHCSKKENM
jgi:hypothetical protein